MAEEIPQVTYASYVAKGGAVRGATAPGVPVFVLKTGMVLAVGNYTYQDGRISYELASGGKSAVHTPAKGLGPPPPPESQPAARVYRSPPHPPPRMTRSSTSPHNPPHPPPP